MRKIPSKLYKAQSFELADYLVDNYYCIPDRIFYLNSSICLELLLKNLIIYNIYNDFLDKENNQEVYKEFITMVKKELVKRKHKIDDLLNLDKKLTQTLSIISVDKSNGDLVNQFIINFEDSTFLLMPTLEALRYGVFSHKQHVAEYYDKEKLLNLLKGVKKYVNKLVSY